MQNKRSQTLCQNECAMMDVWSAPCYLFSLFFQGPGANPMPFVFHESKDAVAWAWLRDPRKSYASLSATFKGRLCDELQGETGEKLSYYQMELRDSKYIVNILFLTAGRSVQNDTKHFYPSILIEKSIGSIWLPDSDPKQHGIPKLYKSNGQTWSNPKTLKNTTIAF